LIVAREQDGNTVRIYRGTPEFEVQENVSSCDSHERFCNSEKSAICNKTVSNSDILEVATSILMGSPWGLRGPEMGPEIRCATKFTPCMYAGIPASGYVRCGNKLRATKMNVKLPCVCGEVMAKGT
jgi:hypothetical protein